MAVDKLVDSTQLDTDLTAVANAIRTKGGTSAQLAFPAGFVDAIDAIETGGGGGFSLADFASGAIPTGEIDISGLTFVDYAFANRTGITSVVGSGTLDGGYLFSGCTGIRSIHISTTGNISSNYFFGCKGLKTAVFKSATQGGTGAFNGCSNLEVADLDVVQLRTNYFSNNTKLATIILRKTDAITALENAAVFATAAHFKSGGSGGTIYAPAALISTYQSATNWSTVNGYGTITWAAIEGSIYETQYADGTPIT